MLLFEVLVPTLMEPGFLLFGQWMSLPTIVTLEMFAVYIAIFSWLFAMPLSNHYLY